MVVYYYPLLVTNIFITNTQKQCSRILDRWADFNRTRPGPLSVTFWLRNPRSDFDKWVLVLIWVNCCPPPPVPSVDWVTTEMEHDPSRFFFVLLLFFFCFYWPQSLHSVTVQEINAVFLTYIVTPLPHYGTVASPCKWDSSLGIERTKVFRSSHDNALRWMPHDLTDDESTLVQVMAWCRQATSHYLSKCWLSSLSP